MPLLKVVSLEGRRRLVCCWCYSTYLSPSYVCLLPVAQVSSVYERCCVLFNIGVLQSQIAKSQNFDNDDGLKNAARHFQVSLWLPFTLPLSSLPSPSLSPSPPFFPLPPFINPVFAQGAAGSFQLLQEQVFAHLQTAPTPDLSAEATTALMQLMLAQAQESFCIKAVKGETSVL